MSGPEPDWRTLRLRDRIAPDLRVLFVGINPGVRSAITGHHFAGFSNRFWKLLVESRLVPEPITYVDDVRLTEWGLGITNLVARPSPGIDDLRPAEYIEGWRSLKRKIARYRPRVVALVGVTLYRAILPHLAVQRGVASALGRRRAAEQARRPDASFRPERGATSHLSTSPVLGLKPETVHGANLFVVPNPSGRNANFSYAEMLAAYRALARFLADRH